MNFAIWSIKNPVPPLLLFILLMFAGFYGFAKLRIQDLPDIEFPLVQVVLSLPGAAPTQLETEVARKVEDSIATVSDVKHMTTSITDGTVMITVAFELEKTVSDALMDTKDAVDRVRPDLPTDLESPVVTAERINNSPLMTYAVSSSKLGEEELSWFVDDKLGKTFMGIEGVGKFTRVGGVSREVRIEVDPVKLASLNITAAEISQALRRMQLETSGGQGLVGQTEQSVRTIATVARPEDLSTLPIALADGRSIRLDQIATIRDTHAKPTEATWLNGKPSVAFQIYGSKGSNEVQIAEDTIAAIESLKKSSPDLTFIPITNTVNYTLEQYDGSMNMLFEGAFLAVLVVGFFLRDWRATLISAAALPLSIIPSFGIIYMLGFSLNTLTLLALAIVVGILIDDAIVEIENIVRHKRMGKSTLQATKDAVTEIALAVIATTLTIIVVFIPTTFMDGVVGLLFKPFGWTVVVSVMMSLLVARLITPLMAAYLLKDHKGKSHDRSEKDGYIMKAYLDSVRWCLSHKITTLLMVTVFFVFSGFLASKLPASFMPPNDMGYTNLSIELPPGSTLEDTLVTAEKVRTAVADVEGIEHVLAVVGTKRSGGTSADTVGTVRKGSIILTFLPKDERPSQSVITAEVRKLLPNIPGARFALQSDGPGEGFSILLSGDNTESLNKTAIALEKELRCLKSISNINSTASLQRPEITIRPDFARAAELGISSEAIADTVRVATSGDFDPQLTKFNLDNRQVYVRVQMAESALQDLDTIANLRVTGRTGQTALTNIATVTASTGPSQIDRYDRQRYVSLNADLGGTALGTAMNEAMALPALQNKPSDINLLEMGDAEIMAELFAGFAFAMITGVLCVFCVLVLLFKDFLQPVTILSALPLSFGGSFIALLATGGQMGLPALIGIIMLMGIVTKNSILLVEYTILGMRERNLSREDALIDACHKRARPIIMTTIAMIAGMLPIALGWGGDASFRQPMAISVIGGLITSTLLSLLVVPVVFTYVNVVELWFSRWVEEGA